MVAPGCRTVTAGSLSSFIAGFHQSFRFSQSSGPRRSCVGTGPAFAIILALEVALSGRAAADRDGPARVDPADERRKSALGSTAYSRRTAQARVRGRAVERRQIHGQTARATQSGMAHLSA